MWRESEQRGLHDPGRASHHSLSWRVKFQSFLVRRLQLVTILVRQYTLRCETVSILPRSTRSRFPRRPTGARGLRGPMPAASLMFWGRLRYWVIAGIFSAVSVTSFHKTPLQLSLANQGPQVFHRLPRYRSRFLPSCAPALPYPVLKQWTMQGGSRKLAQVAAMLAGRAEIIWRSCSSRENRIV